MGLENYAQESKFSFTLCLNNLLWPRFTSLPVLHEILNIKSFSHVTTIRKICKIRYCPAINAHGEVEK